MSINAQELYSQSTKDIVVSISPEFVEERSEPGKNVYVFAYTIRLENVSRRTVQLVNRHWKVMSGGAQFADVKGEGVVGEQPILHPGVAYEYTSWTLIKDPMGSMEGTYTFVSDGGEFFDVAIPRFDLLYVDQTMIH